jgi:uncharacterized ferritin-like protein (DUF455 family)
MQTLAVVPFGDGTNPGSFHSNDAAPSNPVRHQIVAPRAAIPEIPAVAALPRLRDAAARVLLSSRLEDKLTFPRAWSDHRPGPALAAPDQPGRPPELRLGRHAAPFPSGDWEDPEAVGRALHFFANHELLALETMALMLLRFPDAPPGLRRGWASTLQEEQIHLRLYLQRMEDLGVRFGSLPLNDYFWRCFRSVERVEQYLAGMSLTFEQANLDHSARFATLFRRAGDEASAAVMDRVLQDEISHVALGRVWLSRLGGETDLWRQYLASLPPPLVPRRARGERLRTDLRRRAKLPEDFIRRIALAAESRGRTPDVWTLNVEATDRSAGATAAAVRRDLSPLLQLLAPEDDLIAAPRAPSPAIAEAWWQADLPVRGFVDPTQHRPTRAWAPWGLDPCHPGWALSTKRTAARWERALLRELRDPLLGPRPGSDVVSTIDALVRCTEARLVAGPVRWKREVGTSGRGQRTVHRIHGPELAWARRALLSGPLVVEDALSIEQELSVVLDGRRVRVLHGWVERGRYVGHRLDSPWPGLALRGDLDVARLQALLTEIASWVRRRMHGAGHRGPAAFDTVLHRGRQGSLHLRPLMDLNPRTTMGHVADRLARRVSGAAVAAHVLLGDRELRKHTGRSLADWARRTPSNLGPGRWTRGRLWTTDPAGAEHAGLLIVLPRSTPTPDSRFDWLRAAADG